MGGRRRFSWIRLLQGGLGIFLSLPVPVGARSFIWRFFLGVQQSPQGSSILAFVLSVPSPCLSCYISTCRRFSFAMVWVSAFQWDRVIWLEADDWPARIRHEPRRPAPDHDEGHQRCLQRCHYRRVGQPCCRGKLSIFWS